MRGAPEEDDVGEVGFADVAGAFETVDGEEVDAELLGGEGVPDGGAFVQDGDVGGFEHFDDWTGGVAGRFNWMVDGSVRYLYRVIFNGCFLRTDFDAFVDDDLGVGGVVGGGERGEERDVDAEGLGGHGSAAGDFLAEVFGGGLGEGCEDAEATRVRDG